MWWLTFLILVSLILSGTMSPTHGQAPQFAPLPPGNYEYPVHRYRDTPSRLIPQNNPFIPSPQKDPRNRLFLEELRRTDPDQRQAIINLIDREYMNAIFRGDYYHAQWLLHIRELANEEE